MAENKRQHYVQQSYLRRFSADGKRIYVYDKTLTKPFSDGIRNVAQESNFYRLQGLTDEHGVPVELDPLFIEKWFQPLEADFSRAIGTLVVLPREEIIPSDVRDSLAEFIAFQYLRTRAHRNLIIDTGEQFADRLVKEAIKANFGEDYLKYAPKIEYTEKAASLLQIQQLINEEHILELADILKRHVWTLISNATGYSFYTSDTPVVLRNHLKRPSFRPGLGLGSTGIEIAIPLSSTKLLSLRDRTLFGDQADLFDNKTGDAIFENVEFYNSLQVLQSERQIYCEDGIWELVEDMIRENPKLCERKKRISVD